MKPQILLIEDCAVTRFGVVRYFSKDGYQISEAGSLAEAARLMVEKRFDLIIIDINLPDGNGLDFISAEREAQNLVPIIVVTGAGDIPLAVEAMQRGADNFLTKPLDMPTLSISVAKSLELGKLKRQSVARKRLEKQQGIFFGVGPEMQEVQQIARVAADNGHPVLITGETGTGKGMLAKWVHQQGSRAPYEFVELNCSSLRGEMLARELFGTQRGAYTSADQDRRGLVDIADHGSLFLDEIGDMSSEVQAQFLKLLEDKTYRRLGDVKLQKSDFRLICATHRDLNALSAEGVFRQDLFYRINLIHIHLPPLRERRDDLMAIITYLLAQLGSTEQLLTDEVRDLLLSYDWPGNIREMRNVLERALLLTPPGGMLRQSLFSCINGGQRLPQIPLSVEPQTVQQVETAHIQAVLAQHGGNVDKAAKALNLSRATLYRRLKQLNQPTP
ncbi:two component, sigma54 specific, transcriptional regulator, Fis family [Trichlorobacter thiogenes]|uniref:Two component, sigma54 specific, transcriptional regulator, Fis family n=1 Tax=Trichlorobacter thiogenes TaxID=115783 RepID=A0A1T4PCE4_9BACT|nr:sigma-54 dependent transcriptional regulator [Trichlorobacter thiogenes]SJZ89220.1 two component, sigma54 specific, transcriptional regulator, Fis family [Trichlorobacter thiogenes]